MAELNINNLKISNPEQPDCDIIALDCDDRIITLISNDNINYDVKTSIAFQSNFIATMAEGDKDATNFEINCHSDQLSKIIAFMVHVTKEPIISIRKPLLFNEFKRVCRQQWYVDFFDMEIAELLSLLNAINYMDYKSMFDMCCCKIATLIKDKTMDELHSMFDFGQNKTIACTANENAKLDL